MRLIASRSRIMKIYITANKVIINVIGALPVNMLLRGQSDCKREGNPNTKKQLSNPEKKTLAFFRD